MWNTRIPAGLLYKLPIIQYSEAKIFEITELDSSRRNELTLDKPNWRTAISRKSFLLEFDGLLIHLMWK